MHFHFRPESTLIPRANRNQNLQVGTRPKDKYQKRSPPGHYATCPAAARAPLVSASVYICIRQPRFCKSIYRFGCCIYMQLAAFVCWLARKTSSLRFSAGTLIMQRVSQNCISTHILTNRSIESSARHPSKNH